jgi:hypothetical protein
MRSGGPTIERRDRSGTLRRAHKTRPFALRDGVTFVARPLAFSRPCVIVWPFYEP